jgi:SAM-dependent methyltransferase
MADKNKSAAWHKNTLFAVKLRLDKLYLYFKCFGAIATAKYIPLALLRLRAMPRYYASGNRFDEENNVQTSGRALLSELTVEKYSKEHSLWYEPAPINVVPNIFSKLDKSYEYFTFIDLGSGRGRVVLLASQFNFKKVVGVEFAKELHLQACKNLSQYPRDKQQCRNVEFLCIDVMEYDFPQTNLAIFIFDSFKADFLRRLVSKLRDSYRSTPRKIYVVYLNPGPRNEPIPILEGSGFLHKKEVLSYMDQIRFFRNCPYHIVVYEAG